MDQTVNTASDTFRRRRDGLLELVPRVDPAEAAVRAETAIAVLFLLVGAGAALVRNFPMAVLLVGGGAALLAKRLAREYQAWRSVREQPATSASSDAVARRVIRFADYAAPDDSSSKFPAATTLR